MNNFYILCKREFSFLEKLGYKIISINRFRIAYKKNQVIIEILYTDFENEITCNFYNLKNDHFSLQTYLDYCGINMKGYYQIKNNNYLRNGVGFLSGAVKKCINYIDVSKPNNFSLILFYSVNTHANNLNKYYINNDLKNADHLWKMGNYSKAKVLYETNYKALSKVQKARLNYLYKK